MKKFVIQNYYRLIRPFKVAYNFATRPEKQAVEVLIKHKGSNKYLLARHTYGHKLWTIPGGGANKNEALVDAAIREAQEELQIAVQNLVVIGEYNNTLDYVKHRVVVFYSVVENEKFTIDPIEIEEAKWFGIDELPTNSFPRVAQLFDMLTKYKETHAD